MKFARLSALSVAIMMASTAQANEFVDDSTLDIHLRNYYKNNNYKIDAYQTEAEEEDSHSQWAQAIRLNFSSGYYQNLIGVDLGVHHSLKLRSDNGSDNGLLRPSSNDNDSADGYGKTSYALKVNLFDQGVAKYGRMFMDTPLLNDSDSRALPSLTEGFYAEGNFNELSLYGLIAVKENAEEQSGFDKYGYVRTDTDGNVVERDSNAVHIIGGNYDFGQGFTTELAYGQQKEIAKRYYATVNYSTAIDEIGLDFGLQYGHNAVQGKSKDDVENSTIRSDKDTKQHVWGAIASAHYGAATIGVAYTAVEKTDLGDYDFEWGMTEANDGKAMGDSSDYFGYNAAQYGDFNRAGQKAWGINASYNFDGLVEGLNVYGAYIKGKVNPVGTSAQANPDSWKEKEYNLGVSYFLPMIEGLSAHVMYAHNTQNEHTDNEDQHKGKTVNKDTRVIVKYDIAVF